MRKTTALLALIFLLANASAQEARRFAWPGQKLKAAKAELMEAKVKNDSLLNVIDSLMAVKAEKDSIIASLTAEVEEEVMDNSPRSLDEADSLMDIWCRKHRNKQYSRDPGYDMETVHFSSAVSDEELMSRLSAMNPYFTLPFNETVKNYMVLYSEKWPHTMSEVLGLSEYYMPIFEEALSRYGLPLELKYLSIIESRLNPRAVSRVGATGLWQFMYRTAGSYGMRINSYADERMDVDKSTDAAARYLKDMYSIFGDWNLCIAAYNCGPGNVRKAIARAGGSDDYWKIYEYLPRETRGYGPAFVGVMYAMTYFREYGIEAEDMGMPAETDTFEIRRNLHFKQINEVVGVPMEVLRDLNPQYTHDIIPGTDRSRWILKLPYNWSSAFVTADQDSLYNHKSGDLLSPQVLKSIQEETSAKTDRRVRYKVKSGDTLGGIASRHRVSVAYIKKKNHLKSDRIRIGQVLYL